MLLFGTLFWRTGAGTPTPPAPPQPDDNFGGFGYRPSGGTHPADDRARKPEEIRRARERFGIPDLVKAAIAEVAARQAERLEMDRQKQFDELRNELLLRKLDMRAGFMEALAVERERLLDEEIGRRIRNQLDEEMVILLTLIAAASTL